MRRQSEFIGILMLLLAALIWGSAFVAQSVGADYVPAFTFLASRSWVGVAVLAPTAVFLSRRKSVSDPAEGLNPSGSADAKISLKDPKYRRDLLTGGLSCGFVLCAASAAQQIGIADTTTAKSGFLTAMYVVIVPVIYSIVRRKSSLKIWVCVALAVLGLYLLCINGPFILQTGDLLTLLCAVLFSVQILCVNYFVRKVDAVQLTVAQFFFTAIFSTICALIFEHPTWDGMQHAMFSILYAGIMSSGIAYTLQTLGQCRVNPAAASLVMSLESVFSALSGWVVLGQSLSLREIAGCAIMFAAIILTELPIWKSD